MKQMKANNNMNITRKENFTTTNEAQKPMETS